MTLTNQERVRLLDALWSGWEQFYPGHKRPDFIRGHMSKPVRQTHKEIRKNSRIDFLIGVVLGILIGGSIVLIMVLA